MLAILGELCWLQFFKTVYLETSNVQFGSFFQNPVTIAFSHISSSTGPGKLFHGMFGPVCILKLLFLLGENFGSAAQIECEGNNDEKFTPLIARFKGVFKDTSGRFYWIDGMKTIMILWLSVI